MLNQLLKALPFRQIGPSRGGRVVTVAGDPSNPAVYYFGAVCGGVFKTTDAGLTWLNVSDGFFKTSSVGALAVSESHPNVIYAGMGEATIRTDVSFGDGVYKSTDAGVTWKHLGLSDTRHIGKIVIHPTNPDVVYVAALGHAFGEKEATNDERGVFRSRDGGATWQKVLFKSRRAGAVDITLDAHNPDTLYASIWQAHRNFWELSSGGPDSGLWRSRDGGETWQDIGANKGLEKLGLIGKIGVSASPVQAGRVYALIEAKDKPGLYRSDDFGETWGRVSDSGDLRRRPFYYMHVHADPADADTVYVNNLGFHKSTDAGKTWTAIPTPHGDNHALWIDPQNNQRMIQGNDGGANISFNGGGTFGSIYNQLTGQLYHIAADNQFPYRIYATQQDNSSISVPSDTINGAITWSDCYVAGTGESGYIAVKPDDSNIVIVGAVGSSVGGLGALQKYDHSTGQIHLINIWPQPFTATDPANFTHRFPWTYPILFSPHNPNTLYVCGDKVWRSKDLGHSWQALSPDLTRNDPARLKMSGGPITADTSGAEFYCDISTFRESPHEKGVFMAGTDDGLVHFSKNDGETWKDVTPKELPEWSFVRTVEPSVHEPGTWYLAATRYKLDDFAPYLFVTRNDGKTWTKITTGIPDDEFVRVIRADPERKGLLYVGTELGLYVSLDDGASWQKWESTLPVTPIYDLLVKDDDLIIGTHGRGLWVLDDLSALREYAKQTKQASKGKSAKAVEAHLFTPGAAHRVLPDFSAIFTEGKGKSYGIGLGGSSAINAAQTDDNGIVTRKFHDAGAGRDKGVILYYALPEGLPADTKYALEFLDGKGNVIRRYAPKLADYDAWDDKRKSLDGGPWLPAKPGVNRFVWNLRHTGATRVAGNKTTGEVNEGPIVAPGSYTARLVVGEHEHAVAFEVVNDPRVKTTQADLEKQEKMLLRMRDKISQAHEAVNKLRGLREQLALWHKRTADQPQIVESIAAIQKKLDAIEDRLILPGEQKDDYRLISPHRLNSALSELISVVNIADAKPNKAAQALFAEHAAGIDAEVAKLDAVIKQDIAALNALIAEKGVPAVA
jgi:photosystem II stability/assembly factor-like uncharacterized protein